MNELKTLKDLKYFVSGETNQGEFCLHKLIDIEKLKGNAIEHIKDLTENHHELASGDETCLERNFDEYCGCGISDGGSICELCHTLQWIKYSFDIEEKDLK